MDGFVARFYLMQDCSVKLIIVMLVSEGFLDLHAHKKEKKKLMLVGLDPK